MSEVKMSLREAYSVQKMLSIRLKRSFPYSYEEWIEIFTEDYNYSINEDRHYYLYVVLGSLTVNEKDLIEGDGLSFVRESNINIIKPNNAEVILFELV